MNAPSPSRRLVSVLLSGLLVAGALVATVALAPAASAYGPDVYVGQDGTDTANDCSVRTNPCATITYASSQVTFDGTIHVSGTIFENVMVDFGGTITGLDAPAGSPAIIDGGGLDSTIDAFNEITVSGLTIRNGVTRDKGGGMWAHSGATLDRVTVTGNKAAFLGGGIYTGSDLTVIDSTISNNEAGVCLPDCTTRGDGGGIYVGATIQKVVRSSITGNKARLNGGGIYMGAEYNGTLEMTDSTVAGNTAVRAAGILLPNGTITNSTISNNTGQGVVAYGGNNRVVAITGSTIADNSVTQLFLDTEDGLGQVRAGSTILSGTTPCLLGTSATSNTFLSLGYNLRSGGTCGSAVGTDLVGAPALGALAANGGPTQTRLPGAGSSALAAIPTGVTLNARSACARKDQRGVAGPSSGQTKCAIGAAEPGAGVAPAFTSAATATAQPGQAFTHTVTTTGPASWLKISPSTPLPAGLTFTDNRDGTGTLSGTPTSTGTYTFVANNGIGSDRTQSFTLTVAKLPQAALQVSSTSGTVLTPLTLATTGGSGTGAVSYTVANGTATGCAIFAGALNATTAGTCTVTATKAADATYQAVSSAPTAVTLAKATQAALTVTSLSGTVGTSLPLTASGGSGSGAVTYTVINGTATGCAVTGGSLSATAGGTCLVTAAKGTDATYAARASVATGVTLKQAQPVLTLTSLNGLVGTPLALTTSGGGGTGAVSFTVANGSATGCVVTGSTLNASTAGTCTVTATKAADSIWLARSSAATAVTFKQNQAALTVTSLSGTVGSQLILTAAGGSGTGALTFTATNGTATGCSVAGGALSASTGGTCLVTATKAGDTTYVPASSAATAVTMRQAQAVLTVTSLNGTVGTPLTLTTSGGSGTGAVTFAVVNGTATGCAVAGGALTATTGGTCTVTATKAADGTFLARSSVATAVRMRQDQAVLTVTSLSGTVGTPLILTSSGGSGTGAVTFTVANGTATGCAVAGGALSATAGGTCLVTATKASDNTYLARSSVATAVTLKQAQAALTVTSLTGVVGTPLALTSSGGSGNGAVSYSAANGTAAGCAVVAGALGATIGGTCLVTATKPAEGIWLARSSAATAVTLREAQPALTVTSTNGVVGTPFTLTATGGSGSGALSFAVTNGTATNCAIAGGALSATTAGTCLVTATKAADATHLAVSSAATPVTLKQAQAALAVTSTSGTYATPLTLTSSGGSGTGTVTFTAANGTATGCLVSGATLTSGSAGTCLVTAVRAGDGTYLPISSAPTTVTLGKAAQAVLTVTSAIGVFGNPLALAATGGSGTGALTYTVVNGTATGCAITGSNLVATTAGTCTVTVTKATDPNYLARSSAATTVTLAKATQAALTVTSLSGTVLTPLALSASGGSGTGAVTFAVVNGSATGCAITGSTLNATSAGTCLVTATKAADSSYVAMSSSQAAVSLAKATQAALTVTSVNGLVGTPLALTAAGGSGSGAVTFTVANGTATGCAITGPNLSSTSAGTCTVTATRATDAVYAARASVATAVTFKQNQAALILTSVSGLVGTPLALTASGGSGTGALTYAAANGTATGCAIAGSNLSATTAGTCTVTATKAGDSSYVVVSSAPTAVTFRQTQAALTVTSVSGVVGTPLTLGSSGGSGTGAVSFAVVNGTAAGCSIGGSTLSATTAGTCTVTAAKAGDGSYVPVSSAPTTVTLAKQTQAALSVTSLSGTAGIPLALTSSGGSGSGAVAFAVLNGTASGCSVTAGQLSAASAGTCTVTATKATDSVYAARSSAPTTVTLVPAAQAGLSVTSTVGTFGTALPLVTSGGSGTGLVTFAAVDGTTACVVSPSLPYRLTAAGAGTCVVTATKAADAQHSAVSSAATTVTFGKGFQTPLTLTSLVGNASLPLTLTTSGGAGTGAVTYLVADGTATGCTSTAGEITVTTAGTCLVTATKAGDDDYLETSTPETTVSFVPGLQLAGAPGFTGRARVGSTVTAVVPIVVPSDAVVTLRWLRDGTVVGTGKSYPVRLADVGHALRLSVTYAKTGYSDVTVTALVSAKIPAATSTTSLRAKPVKKRKVVSLRVRVSAVGVPANSITGVVRIKRDGKLLRGRYTVRNGVVTIKLAKQPKGRHRYQAVWSGVPQKIAGSSSVVRRVRVR